MTKRILLPTIIILLIGYFAMIYYFNSGDKTPSNEVWTAYIGRDTTVGILPDVYANYYTYTAVRTSDDIGFIIKGTYPDTRYFSFNVYSLGDNTTQGSIVDYQIEPDDGYVNPFLDSIISTDPSQYTISIVPDQYKDELANNTLYFEGDTRLLAIVMRLYDYNKSDTGGVPLPTIQAIKMGTNDTHVEYDIANLPKPLNLRTIVRRRSLPGMVKRLSILFDTEQNVNVEEKQSNSYQTPIPFHAIDTKGYIENNDNRYLLAGITKSEEEVYVFKFRSPSYTTDVTDILSSDVRYWSFNLGNSESYTFNALKDEDAMVDSTGIVTIVLGSEDLAVQALCKQNGYNFMEWNMTWDKGLILFRHMLANSEFEAQIDDVPAIKFGEEDFTPLEAKNYIGEYAPQGYRMDKASFLSRFE